MSVLKIVIADSRQYICGELHGSRAQWVYAACSRNPASLNGLKRLLPKFSKNNEIPHIFQNRGGLDLKPVDAGLIIVDLARKWIYAEDSYFGAHRSGRYRLENADGETDKLITYEFSEKWQFVDEAKWFRYLHDIDLHSYASRQAAAGDDTAPLLLEADWLKDEALTDDPELLAMMAAMETGGGDEYFINEQIATATPGRRVAETANDEDEDGWWGDELSDVRVKFMNYWTGLIDFEPKDDAEGRDFQTLKHILRYEESAEKAACKIRKARKEIASLQIELAAAESLWQRTREPRWALKRVLFNAHIGRQEKHISRFKGTESESAAMAAELRTMGRTERFREILSAWE